MTIIIGLVDPKVLPNRYKTERTIRLIFLNYFQTLAKVWYKLIVILVFARFSKENLDAGQKLNPLGVKVTSMESRYEEKQGLSFRMMTGEQLIKKDDT